MYTVLEYTLDFTIKRLKIDIPLNLSIICIKLYEDFVARSRYLRLAISGRDK